MGNMYEDLSKYENEFYTKRDLRTGLKLVIKIFTEISGCFAVVILVGKLLVALTCLFPPAGMFLTAGTIQLIMKQVARHYPKMNTGERRALRSVASFFTHGFDKFK